MEQVYIILIKSIIFQFAMAQHHNNVCLHFILHYNINEKGGWLSCASKKKELQKWKEELQLFLKTEMSQIVS